MNVVREARRAVVRTADAATAAAGAVGGAAVTGVIGAVEGAAAGVRNGLSSGSRSTATAALTLGAVGVAGLVDWPVLIAVGGGALAIHALGARGRRESTAASSPRAKRPAVKRSRS